MPLVSMAMSRSRAGSAVPSLNAVRPVLVEGRSKPGFGKLAPNGMPGDFKSWLLFGVVFKNVLLIVRQSLQPCLIGSGQPETGNLIRRLIAQPIWNKARNHFPEF